MTRLVTGLFYEKDDAESMVGELKAEGIPGDDIYLESQLGPTSEVGRVEQERRIAGLETGVIIGLTVGLLAGLGLGMIGSALSEWMRTVPYGQSLPALMSHPVWSTVSGGLLGAIIGGLIGCIVDSTLTRLGAGPPLPAQETLVTVRTTDEQWSRVYAALRGRAAHLHVAEHAM